MSRRKDPQTGKLLPEGIHPQVSNRTGKVTYRARISYGPSHRRAHISKTFKHDSAAIDWLLQRQMEVNQGSIIDPSQVTCNDYFWRWFSRKSRRTSESRSLTIKRAWEIYAAPTIGPMKLQSVRKSHIQQIVDQLEDLGREQSTIELYLVGYRSMFASAIEEGLARENPCNDILVAEAPKRQAPVWTLQQLRSFLAAEADSDLYPLWSFLIGTSCRIGEALAVQWDDIDFQKGTVWIRRTVSKGGNGQPVLVDRTKSGRDGRVLVLEDWVIKAINTIPRTEDRIFGKVWDYKRANAINRELGKACERSKLPRITAHGLRHATATAMAVNGVEESIVQEILGHRSRDTTRNIYIHVNLESKRRGSRTLAHLLARSENDAA